MSNLAPIVTIGLIRTKEMFEELNVAVRKMNIKNEMHEVEVSDQRATQINGITLLFESAARTLDSIKQETNVKKLLALSYSFLQSIKRLLERATAYETEFSVPADTTQLNAKIIGTLAWYYDVIRKIDEHVKIVAGLTTTDGVFVAKITNRIVEHDIVRSRYVDRMKIRFPGIPL